MGYKIYFSIKYFEHNGAIFIFYTNEKHYNFNLEPLNDKSKIINLLSYNLDR